MSERMEGHFPSSTVNPKQPLTFLIWGMSLLLTFLLRTYVELVMKCSF